MTGSNVFSQAAGCKVERMESVIVGIVVGVLSSLVASVMWFFALRRLTPRIEISPTLCEITPQETESGSGGRVVTPRFAIKVLNKRRRAVVDIRLELVLIRPRRTRGGLVHVRTRLSLLGEPPLAIAGRRRGDDQDHNAFRFRTEEDLRKLLEVDENSYIRFRVLAKDETSGAGHIFTATYHSPVDEIQSGRFAKGQTFEIVGR